MREKFGRRLRDRVEFSYGFDVDQALALYRQNYRPSERHPKPQCTIACDFASWSA